MVFSSLPFIFFFLPAVLLINRIIPKKWKNGFLLIANLFFYAYGEPVYVLLMMASIAVNFFAAMAIDRFERPGAKKCALILAAVLNLGALGLFKYTGFIFDTLRHIPIFASLPEVSFLLPIGISFYTFQALSYVIDVYRGDTPASRNFIDFGAYISLFPQLIAGPIVRYSDVYRQLDNRSESIDYFADGVRMFAIGLGKKVLLANQFGIMWDMVSASASSVGTAALWLGACAYTLQIYFDFCGYSEMAIGLGKMLGFDFCINFNYPYISKSVTEFWRRWHISLSTWFRDYVYIPLGGNRKGLARQCLNLIIVWTLTGIWHGASWNFVLWGLYYGVLLILEKIFLGRLLEKLPAAAGHIYTLMAVVFGFVIFAFENVGDALSYIKYMFIPSRSDISSVLPWILTLAAGAVCSTPLGKLLWQKIERRKIAVFAETAAILLVLILCTAQLVNDSYNPFLYFRF